MSNENTTPASRAGPLPDAVAVAAAAQQRLNTSSYAALRGIRCETEAGAAVLRGHVASYYFKQLAQEIVRQADAVCRIVNELEVEDRNRSATNGEANGVTYVRSTETRGSTEVTHEIADTDRR